MFCPGLPPKMLLVDDVTTNEQTSDMAAHGRCLIVCSLCFIIVNIEIVSFMLRVCVRRKLSCYNSLPFEDLQGDEEAHDKPRKQYRDWNPVGRKRRTFVHQRAEDIVERG
jgi:hypothetical protein